MVVRQSINQCQSHRNGAVAANAQCSPGWRIAVTGGDWRCRRKKETMHGKEEDLWERLRVSLLALRGQVEARLCKKKLGIAWNGKGLVSHLAAGGEEDASGTLGRGSPSLLLYEAGGLGLGDLMESVVVG